MPVYAVSAYGGRIGLIAANSLRDAERSAKRDVGLDNFQSVKLATKDDVAWVRSMGGYVPAEAL